MHSYERKALNFVESSGSSLMGIWGTRGVGKTTLLRLVHNYYADDSSFHCVFFAGPGVGCTVDTLMDVLNICLGLGLPSRTTSDVPIAKIISSFLRDKTFLLLLDDVRERLHLAAVGLPMPLGHRQKVIFTTRNQAVCDEMGCAGNTIQMQRLGEDDAWNLFRDQVGDEIIDPHPHIKLHAKKMVAECRGLPSTLCTLGRFMSIREDVMEWRYMYDLLKRKRSTPHEIQEANNEGYPCPRLLEDELRHSFF